MIYQGDVNWKAAGVLFCSAYVPCSLWKDGASLLWKELEGKPQNLHHFRPFLNLPPIFLLPLPFVVQLPVFILFRSALQSTMEVSVATALLGLS